VASIRQVHHALKGTPSRRRNRVGNLRTWLGAKATHSDNRARSHDIVAVPRGAHLVNRIAGAAVLAQTPRQRMIAQNYDMLKPFTFEGLLWGQATLRPPAPVYLLLKKEDSRGKSEEWASTSSITSARTAACPGIVDAKSSNP
jgi:hypothetical protein